MGLTLHMRRGTRGVLAAVVVAVLLAPGAVDAQTGPAGTVRYYHADAVGSIRAVTDAQGTVVARHDYFAFGDEPGSAADPAAPRFTGHERDAESGMDYFGARYYMQRAGRFTTVDPVQSGLLQPQRWNRYAYAANNPLRFIDPSGLDVEPAAFSDSGFTSGFDQNFDDWIDGYYEQQWSRAFDALWSNYPTHAMYDSVGPGLTIQELTGVNVANTCALRLSYALNAAGFTIGKSDGKSAMRGKDGQYYLVSRLDLNRFIQKELGFAPQLFSKPDFMGFRQAVANTGGIVSLSIRFADASGHIALINNGQYRDPDYDNYLNGRLAGPTVLSIQYWRMR